jgi:hypothetical protein
VGDAVRNAVLQLRHSTYFITWCQHVCLPSPSHVSNGAPRIAARIHGCAGACNVRYANDSTHPWWQDLKLGLRLQGVP